MTTEAKLAQLGLTLPPAAKPQGLYRPIVVVDDMAYLSGHIPVGADGSPITGRLGQDIDQETGAGIARQVGLAMLATLQAELGSLDRVERLIKLTGFVNCAPDFTAQPVVINGCSQLLADLFGPERGVAARSAVGAASLPLGVPVEIEAVFKVTPAATAEPVNT